MVLPNGLPFSCRERAAETCQKANDLAREAVSWNTVLDGCSVQLCIFMGSIGAIHRPVLPTIVTTCRMAASAIAGCSSTIS
jgi:hypothetical protein